MKWKLLFVLLLVLPGVMLKAGDGIQAFDKPAYYAVMKAGKLADIDKELNLINTLSFPEKDAFEGALLMRKSGLLKIAGEKIKYFKKGRIKLETALIKDNSNCEYHYLRLTIQENAPKIVKYKTELEADKQFIINCFKTLPAVIQQIILDYSKQSKILDAKDLNF